MPVTARDIARELQLSQPTVSRILNSDHQHRVSPHTRRRVLDAARRMGYQPNAVARSLRQGRTNIIGVHSSHNYDVRNDFFGTIIGALQQECGNRQLDLLLHSALRGSSSEEMFGKLRDGRIDGLILHSNCDDALVAMLGQSTFPVVAVADTLPGMTSVLCDDAGGMRLLVEHLARRGYRRMVFLSPEVALSSVARRCEAFVQALRDIGLPHGDDTVLPVEFEKAEPVLDALLERRARHAEPLAVCCWNDRTAYNLLHACYLRGVRVPDDLAIAGFDGFRDDKMPGRQLLTVGCPWERVAAAALQQLVQQIDNRGNDEVNEPATICLPVGLLGGDTA